MQTPQVEYLPRPKGSLTVGIKGGGGIRTWPSQPLVYQNRTEAGVEP